MGFLTAGGCTIINDDFLPDGWRDGVSHRRRQHDDMRDRPGWQQPHGVSNTGRRGRTRAEIPSKGKETAGPVALRGRWTSEEHLLAPNTGFSLTSHPLSLLRERSPRERGVVRSQPPGRQRGCLDDNGAAGLSTCIPGPTPALRLDWGCGARYIADCPACFAGAVSA